MAFARVVSATMAGTVTIGQAKCKNPPDQFWLLAGPAIGILRAMAEPRRLYEQIAQQLARDIADGKYEMGQRLPSERELAQAFDVSRPTVREAIIALELDKLVEVRLGSGVYVINREPPAGAASYKDIGFFELLEARRAIEGEACAMAAMRIDDAQLAQLSVLIDEMREDNRKNEILMSEDADRRFHELIAASTQNTGITAAVQMLWDSRVRSPQNRSMSARVRARGYTPPIEEHAAIVRALKRREPDAARAAMREHLSRVIEDLVEVTEVEELEKARAVAAEKRKRYSSTK
jgi:DNA-binding FadR family transcriptional regulator